MLKNELKAALAIMGTVFVPLFAQADQSMNTTQGQQQQPGYVSGEMVRAGQLPGAYNQSASYMCDDGWDVFVTADYIWWNWSEDGTMGNGVHPHAATITSITSLQLDPTFLDAGYASGFQVGMGFNMHGMDDWQFYGEYTWYKNSVSATNSSNVSVTSPAIASDMDFYQERKISYNNADFLLQRPFYFGKKLTSTFSTGLKALWITEHADVTASGTGSVLSLVTSNITSLSADAKVSSWALGPKFGLDTSWLLGYGVKFLSNISASVVYTRYTSNVDLDVVGSGTVLGSSVPLTTSIDSSVSNYGRLRPIIETYLGLGWGSYFCDDMFHLDLSIGYDFNVHWSYATSPGMNFANNLYLHGLNVQARFDF